MTDLSHCTTEQIGDATIHAENVTRYLVMSWAHELHAKESAHWRGDAARSLTDLYRELGFDLVPSATAEPSEPTPAPRTHFAKFHLTLQDPDVYFDQLPIVPITCRAHFILDDDEGRPLPIVQGYSIQLDSGEWQIVNGLLHDLIAKAFVFDREWLLSGAWGATDAA